MNKSKWGGRLSFWFVLVLGLSLFSACRTDERFLTLGDRFGGPIAVVHAGSYFYILNSDYDRRFDQGSIVVLDPNAPDGSEKIAVIDTPRLGRSLYAQGDWLLVTYDLQELEGNGRVELRSFDDNGISLPVRAAWDIPCSPINAMISPLERYIVVSCLGGDIYVGLLNKEQAEESSLHLVRRYGFSRRALHIYETETQAILFAFPTDIGEPVLNDLSAFDKESYNPENSHGPDGSLILDKVSNEVPDILESELASIRRPERRYPYQMVILDLRTVEAEGFPLILNGTIGSPSQADLERKFVYFTLKTVDGMWETEDQWMNPERKHYRTNFWAARPDPQDQHAFYLSQRGLRESPFANNIIRVKFDPSTLTDTSNLPATSEIFWFEREYGFAGENLDARNYPGDFNIVRLNQEDILLVNHFRDAVYWDPILQKFSIAWKRLGTSPTQSPVHELVSYGFGQSYYQIAVNEQGTAVSCSFYGDSVLIMDVDPESGISLRKQIY